MHRWHWALAAASPVELTRDSFDRVLQSHTAALVNFQAPWCVHCQKLAPDFEAAAIMLAVSSPSTLLATVDCSKEKALRKRFGITEFPSLVWFDGNKTAVPYEGPLRPSDAMADWITVMVNDPVEELEAVPEASTGAVATLVASQIFDAFHELADENRREWSWKWVKSTANPTLVLQHPHEEVVETALAAAPTLDVLREMLAAAAFPRLGEMKDGRTYEKYKADPKGMVWILPELPPRQGLDEAITQMRPQLLSVAKQYPEYHLVYVDTRKFSDAIDSVLGVSQFPAVVLQPWGGSPLHFVRNGPILEPDLGAWIADARAGEPLVKSEVPAVDTSTHDAVGEPITVVGSQLELFFSEKAEAPIMLHLFARWCGHCNQFQKEFAQLAHTVHRLGIPLVVARMDVQHNDSPLMALQWKEVPSAFLGKDGEITEYTGPRLHRDLLYWLVDRIDDESSTKIMQYLASIEDDDLDEL